LIVEFRSSFERDLRNVKDAGILNRVKNVIESAEKAKSTYEIGHIKSLRGKSDYYRIKVGDYRIGLILDGEILVFVRILHRKDIYRYFP